MQRSFYCGLATLATSGEAILNISAKFSVGIHPSLGARLQYQVFVRPEPP